ncbi:MAG: hypothetical protein ACT4TC_22825 [Myxococcaceae bacterium]
MKPTLCVFSVALATLTTGCGKPTATVDPPYVADQRCGIDCAAQKSFNLQVGRCFEYSKGDTATYPPDLGVLVDQQVTLEGDVKALELSYSELGQIRMTDAVTFRDGDLLLMRRKLPGGMRVQYTDGKIFTGLPWVKAGMTSGETVSVETQAELLLENQPRSVATTFKVSAIKPDPAMELTTPFKAYDAGLKLVFTETPYHGAESRRIFVDEVGFVAFSTRFALTDTVPSTFYKLQNVREITDTSVRCGLEMP